MYHSIPEKTQRCYPITAARMAIVLWLLLAAPLLFGQSASDPRLTLDQIGSGELLRKTERGFAPLPVVDLVVEISVTGPMIHGRIAQRFVNDSHEVIEVLYAFPLPHRAAVHHMEMQIGERRIVAKVQEREEARQTYEKARDSGRKAALVTQQRPNLFTTAAANINPGETVAVSLEYYEQARYVDGRFELRFPLTFTPRFCPPESENGRERGAEAPAQTVAANAGGRPATAVRPSVALRVLLRPGFPLESVKSDSHAIERLESGGGEVEVRPEAGGIVADRDFLLSWAPRQGELPGTSFLVEERDGARYALITILPPRPGSDSGLGLPTETLFVVDVSGSMAGPSIEQAREALLAALGRLRPEDRFNILLFDSDSVLFRPEFQHAEADSLSAAVDWVRRMRAAGGTMIYPALMRSIALLGESRGAHAQRIVFLTDGAVDNEQELFRALHQRLGDVRLHTIGIGQAPNAYLMRKMARLGHGLCEFVSNTAQAENQIAAFLERLDRPVLEAIQLETHGTELEDLYPATIPDLHAGEPLVLSARLGASASDGVRLGGYGRAGWIESDTTIPAVVPEGSGVALRWARAKVAALMDTLHEDADPTWVRSEVVDLALDFRLVTRYTSLVAVEQVPTAIAEGRSAPLASALPVGGTDGPAKRLLGSALALAGLFLLLVRLRWAR